MKPADALTRLRRLAQAEAGPGLLRLPPDLSPGEALEAVRCCLGLLQPPPPAPPAPRRPPLGGGAARIHIDGGSRGNPGPAGIGVAIYDAEGRLQEGLARFIGRATNNMAEYRALLLALERAETLGLSRLAIYSDSELLVRQLQGRYQVKHPLLRPLFAEAKRRIAELAHFEVHHVPREQNAEADRLANQGMDAAGKGAGLADPGGAA